MSARDTAQIDVELLPQSVRDLVTCMGLQAAEALLKSKGGAYVVVPVRVSPDHMLLDLLGAQAFARLVEWYAGEQLMLPKVDSLLRQVKHREIVRLRAAGMTVSSIALATGYTMRYVFMVLEESHSGAPREPQCGDLFAGIAGPDAV